MKVLALMCLNIGTPKTIKFPLGTYGKFMILDVLILKRIMPNGAVKTAFDIQVNGKMTWKQLTERDRREWKLSAIDPHDGDTWRSGV